LNADYDNDDDDDDDDVDFTVLALRDIEEMENKIEKRREWSIMMEETIITWIGNIILSVNHQDLALIIRS
jgi:hypothetical protein